MVLNSGSLNRRIQVMRYNETGRDGFGGSIGDWEKLGVVLFARRRDVTDAEELSGGAVGNNLVVRFIVRSTVFTRDIKRHDMIAHEGAPFDIKGIKEVTWQCGFLEITAVTSERAARQPLFEV